MRVISASSCDESQIRAAQFIANDLSAHTSQGQNVLWLISGGSAVKVAVAAAQNLDVGELKLITLAQVDERFVPPGSDQENWQQLISSGLNPPNFKQTVSILSCGNSLESATDSYGHILDDLLKNSSYRFGLFGIGSNGHTAGIMPMEDTKDFQKFMGPSLTVGYQAEDFTRITITAAAIKRLDGGVTYACGQDKRAVVAELNSELPAHAQPAQLLKQIPALVVFN